MTKETVQKIFDEEINPYVQEDGGHIELLDVQHGFVFVKLQGACSGCPSSLVTLKQSVSALLLEYFPNDFITVINET